MYYVIFGAISLLVFYVLVKILSSVLKGCLVTLVFIVLVITLYLMYKSTIEPVPVLNLYRIQDFKVTRIA
jgi:hypothetical protein